MNKRMLQVILLLSIFLVMFSVIVFAIPFEKTPFFWIAYGAEVLAIALQIPVFKLAYGKSGTLKSKFLGFPVFRVGYIYLAVQTIVSIILFAAGAIVDDILLRFAAIPCILIFGIALMCGIMVDAVRDEAENLENSQETETRKIKQFRMDTKGLPDLTDDAELKKMLTSLSDEFKYSDPVSSSETEEIENTLTGQMTYLKTLLREGDTEKAKVMVQRMRNTLDQRNKMCKMYKN